MSTTERGPPKNPQQGPASTGPPDKRERQLTPVGIIEIAERLGVERATVDMWKYRGLLPEPKWTVGGRPAWNWTDIERWARATGRA